MFGDFFLLPVKVNLAGACYLMMEFNLKPRAVRLDFYLLGYCDLFSFGRIKYKYSKKILTEVILVFAIPLFDVGETSRFQMETS